MAARTLLALAAIGLVVATAGCAPADPVDAYADAAIADMAPGLYADTAAFQDAVAAAKPQLYAAKTIPDTYPILDQLIKVAGGPHSRLLTPTEIAGNDSAYSTDATFPVPTAQTKGGVTVLDIPAFAGSTDDATDRYTSAGIRAVQDARAATTCGWVIDLRTNSGGKDLPMLDTVSPFLDDGQVAGFQERDGDTTWITVDQGTVAYGDVQGGAGFTIDQPVALLTSDGTASAAEVLVVAFAGQADAIRVGTPTYGFTTGNEGFPLSDGAVEILTTSHYVDRTGHVYDGPIPPDVAVPLGSAESPIDVASDRLRAECG